MTDTNAKTLKQKRLFTERQVRILESKLYFRQTIKWVSDNEVQIPFEDLASYRTSHMKSEIYLAAASAFFYFLAGFFLICRHDKDVDPNMWMFLTLGATGVLFLFILKREDSWRIKTNNFMPVFLFKKVPNTATVDEFIETIFIARNKYLRDTYLEFDKKLSYEDLLKNLKWLRYTEAISKAEFDEKYEELKVMFSRDSKTIGFDR